MVHVSVSPPAAELVPGFLFTLRTRIYLLWPPEARTDGRRRIAFLKQLNSERRTFEGEKLVAGAIHG